jgi:hypothetical protein
MILSHRNKESDQEQKRVPRNKPIHSMEALETKAEQQASVKNALFITQWCWAH